MCKELHEEARHLCLARRVLLNRYSQLIVCTVGFRLDRAWYLLLSTRSELANGSLRRNLHMRLLTLRLRVLFFNRYLLGITCLFVLFPASHAYSVLSHEQVVDLVWKDNLQPMILHRFPGATEDDLRRAHAFAYGGCLVQDMGYYPFGNTYFSDLTHYVRSGDFVEN